MANEVNYQTRCSWKSPVSCQKGLSNATGLRSAGDPLKGCLPQHPFALSLIIGTPPTVPSLHMLISKQMWTRSSLPPTPAEGSRSYSGSTLLETWPWSHLCPERQQVQWLLPFSPLETNCSDHACLGNGLTFILLEFSGWLVLKKDKSTAEMTSIRTQLLE